MLCAKCGTNNLEGASFCAACGAPLSPAYAQQPAEPPSWGGRPQTSGMAIASLVLGIGGLFIPILAPLVGLILGIVALGQIGGSRGRQTGSGLAIAGICVSALMLLIVPAMLFPVFMRARQAARKVQCLSNMKNLAIATQMYLADWDAFWPSEHEMKPTLYFNSAPGGGTPVSLPGTCNHLTHANPYLREPVVLDEYIKNRDVWKCSNARTMEGARFIVPLGPNGDWVQRYKDHEGDWGKAGSPDTGGPCHPAFPPGWGGEVTDSLTQGRMANTDRGGAEWARAFVSGYGVNGNCRDLNFSAVWDPMRYVVIFESDVGCSGRGGREDLVAEPRHSGGDNWGFGDGHAKWWPRDAAGDAVQWEPEQGGF